MVPSKGLSERVIVQVYGSGLPGRFRNRYSYDIFIIFEYRNIDVRTRKYVLIDFSFVIYRVSKILNNSIGVVDPVYVQSAVFLCDS